MIAWMAMVIGVLSLVSVLQQETPEKQLSVNPLIAIQHP
jgi:hypothetical protein